MPVTLALEAIERRGVLISGLLRLLEPRPGRLAFASRLALICALTTLIVEIYQTPDAALTTYIVFFLNKPDRVESVILDVVFTILITLLVGLVILLAKLFLDDPLWRVAVTSAFSVGFLFVAFASKLRPFGGIITLIVGYALDVLGTLHSGELATRATLYVWLFIAIPAGVSVAVNLVLGPPPRGLAEQAIAARLRIAASLLRKPDQPTRSAFVACLREGTGEIQAWLKLAGIEKTSPPQDLAALRQAAQSTAAILSWVDVVSRDAARLIPGPLLERLAQTLEDMAAVVLKGAYPIEIAFAPDNAIAAACLPPHSVRLWADMCDLLARFSEPPQSDSPPTLLPTAAPARTPMQAPLRATAPRPTQSVPQARPSPKPASSPQPPTAAKSGGFFLPDAFTNPEYIRYALKTTAAAMFCYVLYSLLDWPSIHTCFITCYIVSLGTTAETVEKLTLRIAGCIIGGAAGIAAIVYVLPHMTAIQDLLGVVFLGALASAWVAAGSPRISYAGFQMAFAFFLCVIQGPSPEFDLTIARDRVIGILLGNVVVYLLFTRLWPVNVAKGIDPGIVAILRQLSSMAVAPTPATRRSLAAQAQGTLGTLEQSLDLARYEPPAIRPPESWLRARRATTGEIGALQGPLLASAGRESSFDADVARRLHEVAENLQAQHRATTLPGKMPACEQDAAATGDHAEPRYVGNTPPTSCDQDPLSGMILSHLQRLEAVWGLTRGSTPIPEPASARERSASHGAI